jgi:tyrosinase
MDYPLKPFNKDSSSYWTSNDAKDWTALGYTYPEFSTSDGSKASITKFVNSLYGSSPSLTAGAISAQIASPSVNETASEDSANAGRGTNSTAKPGVFPGSYNLTRPDSYSLLPTSTRAASGSSPSGYKTSSGLFPLISSIVGSVEDLLDSFLDSTGAAYEYACNIQTPRYALNGSYYIYVFNGAPSSEDPSTWVTDGNLAGMMGVLANPEGMAGNDLIVTGSIPLTRSLRAKVTLGSLISMAFDVILPYLTKNVEWRIVKDGEEVDCSTVEGFKASIYSYLVKKSDNAADIPSYSDYTPQLEVTKDKKGGADKAIFGTVEENQSGNSVPSYGGDDSSSGSGSDSGSEEASYPSGPATASAYGSVNFHPVEDTCAPVTTTIQEYETVYVTASEAKETVPVEQETHPVAYPTAEESKPVETHPVETHPAAPYPVPSTEQASAHYPTATGKPVAPVYPSGTGGKS